MDPALSPAGRRAASIARHLAGALPAPSSLELTPCLSYAPPESNEPTHAFPPAALRALLDGHHLRERDWVFGVMEESPLFCRRSRGGGKVFVSPDYNEGKEAQREATMRRVAHLARLGVFRGFLTQPGADAELRMIALGECVTVYDHSLAILIGVHFFLWFDALLVDCHAPSGSNPSCATSPAPLPSTPPLRSTSFSPRALSPENAEPLPAFAFSDLCLLLDGHDTYDDGVRAPCSAVAAGRGRTSTGEATMQQVGYLARHGSAGGSRRTAVRQSSAPLGSLSEKCIHYP